MPTQESEFQTAISHRLRSIATAQPESTGGRRAIQHGLPEGFQERRKAVRRRASRLQGRGLETLGHAVEYLVDSRLFLIEPTSAKAERDALQILMKSSRALFAECQEVPSVGDRLAKLWSRFAHRPPQTAGQVNGVPQL